MTRRDTMTARDYANASKALVDWLASQDIDPEDAPRVLTMTLISYVNVLAKAGGRDPKIGGKIITDIIMRSLRS
jgi:hypothetical protein